MVLDKICVFCIDSKSRTAKTMGTFFLEITTLIELNQYKKII